MFYINKLLYAELNLTQLNNPENVYLQSVIKLNKKLKKKKWKFD